MSSIKSILEFGTSKIVCMIDTTGIREMDIPAASCVRYEGIKYGSWVNADALSAAIEDAITTAEKKCSKQIKNIFVGVPADFSKTILGEHSIDVQAGIVNHDIICKMAELSKPKNLNDYTLIEVRPVYFMDSSSNIYVDLPIGIRTKSLKAMFSFFYAKKSFVSDVSSILDGMHIRINGFINEIYQQAKKYIPENDRISTSILVDVGYTQTTVSSIYFDSVTATDVIQMGGETIVRDLVSKIGTSPHIAESLKRGHVFGLSSNRNSHVYGRDEQGRMIGFSESIVREIIEDRMYELCHSITMSIRGFIRNSIVSKKAPIYLSGCGIVMKGAETFLQNVIGKTIYPVRNPMYNVFTPIYNTAFSLLDNNIDKPYDLCVGVYQSQVSSKLGRLFK